MSFAPRPHQAEAMEALRTYLEDGGRRGLFEIPTGGGKSPLCGMFAELSLNELGGRCLIVTDTQELVEQNADAVRLVDPSISVGIYSAGLKSRQTRNDVIVASIQSIYKKPEILGKFAMCVIDECHAMGAKTETGRYVSLLSYLRTGGGDPILLGTTATPWHMTGGHLCEDVGTGSNKRPAVFDKVVYSVSIRRLVKEGYLCPMFAPRVDTSMSAAVDRVGRASTGDFKAAEATEAANTDELNEMIVAESIRLGADRKCWLTFAQGVEHAHALKDWFNCNGVPTEVLTGETPDAERKSIIRAHKAGELRNVANMAVLTKGYDNKAVDFIVMARATHSRVLMAQMAGRGLRCLDGKADALFADFGGNIARHGPLDLLDSPPPKLYNAKKKEGAEQICVCKNCLVMFAKDQDKCPSCGTPHERPEPSIIGKLTAKAAGGVLISDGSLSALAVDGKKVATVTGLNGFAVHQSKSFDMKTGALKPAMLRVVYDTSAGPISMWLTMSGANWQTQKAAAWWRDHGLIEATGRTPPATAEEAHKLLLTVGHLVRLPTHLQIEKNDRGYWQITKFITQKSVELA